MVQYRRNFVAGGTYFFTAGLWDRRKTLLVDHVDLLRQAFMFARQQKPFRIDAIVVLPDHLHALWTLPPEDADFSGRWRTIKSRFSRALARDAAVQLPRDDRGEYHLWQRRFWEHTIRDQEDFNRHVDYIHFNPVKHGYVSSAKDWRYSSFHHFVAAGALPADWASGDSGAFGERYGE